MAVTIASKNKEQIFDKEIINIGTNPECDFVLKADFDFMLTLQYDRNNNKCCVLNNFKNEKILFKGQPIGQKLDIDKICKLLLCESDDFISIKITENAPAAPHQKTGIELEKARLEKSRVSIIKQVAYTINDLKKRLSLNFKASLFLHAAMFLSALVTAFGVSNYLMGLPIEETKNFLHLPANIKILFTYTVIIYGICLMLKQGIYLFLQNKIQSNVTSKIAETFMLIVPSLFVIAIYAINVIYYMSAGGTLFAVLISLFFTGIMTALAMACGYFKSNGQEISVALDKFEYREDFECTIDEYRHWIDRYVNNLSDTKIRNIKDKLFSLQLKSAGELLVGLLTAPFLAYGVSNTLAMCFPEAAGWIRISGLRFSPVFLVLATFLIIFAFFAFVNAFLSIRKIQGSNVIKQDGFSNYLAHGTDIFGLEGIRKLNSEKTRSLVIAIAIIAIEFTMNTSYFLTEIGGDLQGIFLSVIAALVPTALLIAETYMLSQTKFDIYASEELIAKIDK